MWAGIPCSLRIEIRIVALSLQSPKPLARLCAGLKGMMEFWPNSSPTIAHLLVQPMEDLRQSLVKIRPIEVGVWFTQGGHQWFNLLGIFLG
jgi:hypothetical protein